MHAVVLLAHYHALASFVFGSGINPERDPDTSNGVRLIAVNNFCVCDLANDNNIENASLTSSNFGVSVARRFFCLPLFCIRKLSSILSCLNFRVARKFLSTLLECLGLVTLTLAVTACHVIHFKTTAKWRMIVRVM